MCKCVISIMSAENSPVSTSRRTPYSRDRDDDEPSSSRSTKRRYHKRQPRNSHRNDDVVLNTNADLKRSQDIWIDGLVHKLYGILIERFEEIWMDCDDMKARDVKRPEEKQRLKDWSHIDLFKYQMRKIADWPTDIQKEESDAVIAKFPKLMGYLRKIMAFKLGMVAKAQLERTPDTFDGTSTLKATVPNKIRFVHDVLANFAWEIMKTEEKYGDQKFILFKPARDKYKRRYRREKAARFARSAIFNTLDEVLRVANALDENILADEERKQKRRNRPPETPSYIRTPKSGRSHSKKRKQQTPTYSDTHSDHENEDEESSSSDEQVAETKSHVEPGVTPKPTTPSPAVAVVPQAIAPAPAVPVAIPPPQVPTVAPVVPTPAPAPVPSVTVTVPPGATVRQSTANSTDEVTMLEKQDEVGEAF